MKNKEFGQAGARHVVMPKYNQWGLSGDLTIKPLPNSEQVAFDHQLTRMLPLDDLKLNYSALVKHYAGEDQPERKLALLRYSRLDGSNSQLGGEHVSATYDIASGALMGLTRMRAELDNESFVSHQTALVNAIQFLQIYAADLIGVIAVPQLVTLIAGRRMEFSPPLALGDKIECHWIDAHQETINLDDTIVAVHGMKVKLFIPETQLWAWVIVDKHGQIETFERDISWDFDIMQRKTQMWLHDGWLLCHDLMPLGQ